MTKQTENLRNQMAQTREEIEELVRYWTGLSNEQHRLLIYNSGIEFLQLMEGTHFKYFKVLESKKSFWTWWSNKWYSRDRAFIVQKKEDYQHLKSQYVEPIYKQWHDLKHLRRTTPIEHSYYRLVDAIL